MVDNTETDDDFMDMDDEAALYQARCVYLGKHPKNYDFYLEPGQGNLRVIRCRRGNRYLPTPAALGGAYTDGVTAMRAVTVYIGNIGKAKPLPINGIIVQPGEKDELDAAIEQDVDGDEAQVVEPPVIDLTDTSAKQPDDIEESITVRARRQRQQQKK